MSSINQLGKLRYPEIALANLRIAQLERMLFVSCADLGAVNEALGVDPESSDDGPGDIIKAIGDLKNDIARLEMQIAANKSDFARLDFIESSPNLHLVLHKKRWSLRGMVSYSYPGFKTLRKAIDKAIEIKMGSL